MKQYYAYVSKDMIPYFEEKLSKHDVVIIHQEWVKDTDGTVSRLYILEAKEGIINPKFEM